VRGIDRQRREDRKDLVLKVRPEAGAFGRVQVPPPHELHVFGGERRLDLAGEAVGMPGHQRGRLLGDALQLLAGQQPVRAAHGQAHLHPPLQPGHPDHVELVEIAGEDREELGALQQGGAGILGEGEHPGVEVQPGQFAVEVAIGGQFRRLRWVRPVGRWGRRFGRWGHGAHAGAVGFDPFGGHRAPALRSARPCR
jgi:hypothetical protein